MDVGGSNEQPKKVNISDCSDKASMSTEEKVSSEEDNKVISDLISKEDEISQPMEVEGSSKRDEDLIISPPMEVDNVVLDNLSGPSTDEVLPKNDSSSSVPRSNKLPIHDLTTKCLELWPEFDAMGELMLALDRIISTTSTIPLSVVSTEFVEPTSHPEDIHPLAIESTVALSSRLSQSLKCDRTSNNNPVSSEFAESSSVPIDPIIPSNEQRGPNTASSRQSNPTIDKFIKELLDLANYANNPVPWVPRDPSSLRLSKFQIPSSTNLGQDSELSDEDETECYPNTNIPISNRYHARQVALVVQSLVSRDQNKQESIPLAQPCNSSRPDPIINPSSQSQASSFTNFSEISNPGPSHQLPILDQLANSPMLYLEEMCKRNLSNQTQDSRLLDFSRVQSSNEIRNQSQSDPSHRPLSSYIDEDLTFSLSEIESAANSPPSSLSNNKKVDSTYDKYDNYDSGDSGNAGGDSGNAEGESGKIEGDSGNVQDDSGNVEDESDGGNMGDCEGDFDCEEYVNSILSGSARRLKDCSDDALENRTDDIYRQMSRHRQLIHSLSTRLMGEVSSENGTTMENLQELLKEFKLLTDEVGPLVLSHRQVNIDLRWRVCLSINVEDLITQADDMEANMKTNNSLYSDLHFAMMILRTLLNERETRSMVAELRHLEIFIDGASKKA